jgi:L-glutamine:2-deoxy-scyllo-inosose/3-amino-2,3-dideoxy-scyllo-inosose aminotransferase
MNSHRQNDPASASGTAANPRGWPLVWDLDDTLTRFKEVLRSGCWSVRSPHWGCASEDFEREWAAYCGTKHAILVPSGSSAIELALQAFAIGPGDEVIVPALGWYATTAAVLRVGAIPVFADIDPVTSCVDPREVESCVTARTRAVIVVHLYGSVCDMRAFLRLAESRQIHLIEDCAQAHGAIYRDGMAGSLGEIGCFSFNQEKLLSVGEGGAVTTDSDMLAERVYAIRTDGYRRPAPPAEPFESGNVLGRNLCISEFAAAFLSSQFCGFESQETMRQKRAAKLAVALVKSSIARPLRSAPGTTRQVHYEYGFFLDKSSQLHSCASATAEFLSQVSGISIHGPDLPPWNSANMNRISVTRSFPQAQFVRDTLFLFHHRFLLAEETEMKLSEALSLLERQK